MSLVMANAGTKIGGVRGGKRPQEVNISLPYFHGKDNVEAYLD